MELLERVGTWIEVTDPYEELAELYADEQHHTHNAHVSQHEEEFEIDVEYPENSKSEATVTFQILQNQSTQGKGQTGFCLWDGAVCLARFLARNTHKLELGGSRIIEVGSGSGLVSLSLLHHTPPVASVTMTDQEALLKHLRRNLTNHQERQSRPSRVRGSTKSAKATVATEVHVEELEWGLGDPLARHPALQAVVRDQRQRGDDESAVGGWDLVISSDCVYNEHLVGIYVATLKGLLLARVAKARHGVQYRAPIAFVCFELRSDHVTLKFLETLFEAHDDLLVLRLSREHLPPTFQSGSLALYAILIRDDDNAIE
ncbi:hypothetical protein H9P43_001672 [Blastocladiella emersonii ATCC 22665]|nr:hypothetical protein H9P43_001672 [Blastocladiella emersonii ATCC 22665]